MKNIYKIYILIFTLSLYNCSVDNIEPINLLNDSNVIRDAKSARLMANGIYLGYRKNSTYAIKALTDGQLGLELTSNGSVGIPGALNNDISIDNSTTEHWVSQWYNTNYLIINRSNWLIDLLEANSAPDLSDEEKAELIALGKFFRADSHFRILLSFGQFYDTSSTYGIVIKTVPSTDLVSDARSTVQEAYDQIIEDLLFAVKNLPTNVKKGYISRIVAEALLAKVYLFSKNYTQAAELALKVIDNSYGYTLETNYQNVFLNKWNSSEVLFAPVSTKEDDDRFFPPGWSTEANLRFSSYSEYFKTLADSSDGIPNNGDIDSGVGFDPRFAWAYSSLTSGPLGNAKYGDDFPSDNTLFFYRLAEYYLIYAEAEARKPGGNLNDALNKLNVIRTRASVPLKTLSTKEQLLEDIRVEKQLELFTEVGESWFDLIRYHDLGDLDAFSLKPSLTSKDQFIFPFTLKMLETNNKLIQNPGY